jgi:hypothetical protein
LVHLTLQWVAFQGKIWDLWIMALGFMGAGGNLSQIAVEVHRLAWNDLLLLLVISWASKVGALKPVWQTWIT